MNVCLGKMSEAQGKCLNMSALKLMFLDFFFLLNHRSSQGVFSKDIYHGTIMIYDTKTISCTIRGIYYTKTT